MTTIEVAGITGVEGTREGTRRFLAFGALFGFIGLLVIIIIAHLLGKLKTIDDTVKIITSISSILSGVVGAIVGFYFRSEESS